MPYSRHCCKGPSDSQADFALLCFCRACNPLLCHKSCELVLRGLCGDNIPLNGSNGLWHTCETYYSPEDV